MTLPALFRGLALAATIGLGACASTSTTAPTHQPEPAACADSLYLVLKRQHPDSLSERAWQRLQAMDRECAEARAASHARHGGMMGGGMHGGRGAWGMLGVAAIVVMLAMMSLGLR